MEYKATLTIPKDKAREMQRILNHRRHLPNFDSDGIFETFTARFANKYEADIKVCNGDSPYVDAVLFDPEGHERCVDEVSDTLLGDYYWKVGEDNYYVKVEKGE